MTHIYLAKFELLMSLGDDTERTDTWVPQEMTVACNDDAQEAINKVKHWATKEQSYLEPVKQFKLNEIKVLAEADIE